MTQRGTEFWTNGAVPIIGPEVLISIVASAADAALVLAPNHRVVSVMVNPNTPGLSQLDTWYGADFLDGLTVESVPKFKDRTASLLKGGEAKVAIELNHRLPDGEEMPMSYSVFRVGSDGSILMLGRDLRPIAQLQQQLIESQATLERDYERQREASARLRTLMEQSDHGVVYVSLSTGRIENLNQTACSMLGKDRDDLVDGVFGDYFEGAATEVLQEFIQAGSDGLSKPVAAKLKSNGASVSVRPTVFRAVGERVLMCRLAAADKTAAVRDDHAQMMNGLFENMSDGVVFIDPTGVIQSANEAFLTQSEVADVSRVVGRSFADFVERGTLDLRLIIDNASRTGKVRMFSTRLRSAHDEFVPVEINVTRVGHSAEDSLALIVRDTRRIDATKSKTESSGAKHAQSVAELVGSAPLKEIVAQTTDVVEKMCIETAVDMTSNNRVAASEMLGLSRQSLYVKLRKYGLLDRDGE